MRMLKPSPGELADRQTILELKIEHTDREITDSNPSMELLKKKTVVRTVVEGGDKKINVGHFFDELELIQNYLKRNYILDITDTQVKEYDQLFDELTEINSELWDLEDKAYVLRRAPMEKQQESDYLLECRDTLKAIGFNNEKRSELVKKINELWGIKAKEKLYA